MPQKAFSQNDRLTILITGKCYSFGAFKDKFI